MKETQPELHQKHDVASVELAFKHAHARLFYQPYLTEAVPKALPSPPLPFLSP